jgi:hypothetical protein
MHIVTVIIKNSPHLLQFHFDHFAQADKAMRQSSTGATTMEDDYGSKCNLNPEDVSAIFITDLDKEFEASEKVELAKVARDNRIRKKVAQDPAMRLAMPNYNNPQ